MSFSQYILWTQNRIQSNRKDSKANNNFDRLKGIWYWPHCLTLFFCISVWWPGYDWTSNKDAANGIEIKALLPTLSDWRCCYFYCAAAAASWMKCSSLPASKMEHKIEWVFNRASLHIAAPHTHSALHCERPTAWRPSHLELDSLLCQHLVNEYTVAFHDSIAECSRATANAQTLWLFVPASSWLVCAFKSQMKAKMQPATNQCGRWHVVGSMEGTENIIRPIMCF